MSDDNTANPARHILEQELMEQFQSNPQLFDFIDQVAMDGIWYCNLENTAQEWISQKLWQVLGYDTPALDNKLKTWQGLIVKEDLDNTLTSLKAYIENPINHYDQIMRCQHQDGSTVWFRCKGMVIRDDADRIIRMLVAHQDISHLKESEAQKIQQSERLELVVNSTNMGIWDWMDTNSGEVYWSSGFFKLLGYADQEIPSSFELFTSSLHPADKDATLKALEDHLNKNLPYDVEYRLQKKDGTYCWFRATGHALRDAQGKPTRMLGSVESIDERKSIETLKLKAEERFKLAVTGASVGVWDWMDVNVSEQYWSPKFYSLLGYSETDLIPTFENFVNLIHLDDQQLLFHALDAHFDEQVALELEYRLKMKSGQYHWFRGAGIASRDENGKALRMVGSIEYIHSQKVAEENLLLTLNKLANSNQELEQFAYAASHDLQEPLRTVSSYLQLIERRYRELFPAEAMEFFGIVIDGCNRMKNLIDDLLQFSRIREGEHEFNDVNIQNIISKMVAGYKDQNPELSLSFTYEGSLIIKGVASFLERLFANIINNAIKYRHPDRAPVVVITALVSQGRLIVTIEDNGIGIDEKYFDKIFEVFQRLHAMDSYEGTGIGLALCKKIVKMHQGEIYLESEVNKGSRFNVEFPISLNHSL